MSSSEWQMYLGLLQADMKYTAGRSMLAASSGRDGVTGLLVLEQLLLAARMAGEEVIAPAAGYNKNKRSPDTSHLQTP